MLTPEHGSFPSPQPGVVTMVKEKQTKREAKKAPLMSKKEKKAAKAAKGR
jgi:hypothetical protein